MAYKTHTSCRLCGGPFEDIINLGDIYLNTFLGTNDELPDKAPLDLVRCTKCDLVQLRDTVDFNSMYKDYWYQSKLNPAMIEALADVVSKAQLYTTLYPGDIVVDIGSNDGTLLSHYTEYVTRVGFEPSNVANDLESPHHIFHTYFSAKEYNLRYLGKARIITAIAMFYDLEDPHTFVSGVKQILHDDGVFVIQMMDLRSMLTNADFPNLCHEHLEYYSLNVLNKLLLGHGLQIVDFEYNNVNGASLRVYVKHLQHKSIPVVEAELDSERRWFAHTDQFALFNKKIQAIRDITVDTIRALNHGGYKVAVMGASTKGNTTLQYFELTDADIVHAAEINPDKYGRRTVGSNIPIIPEKESLESFPDYYLILPWGFIDTFVKRNYDYLIAGGKFIVPLPEPRIIGMDEFGVWTLPLLPPGYFS